MDARKFADGLAKGESSVVKHENGAYLFTVPGGFDKDTGEKKPPVELSGLLKKDIDAARAKAEKEVVRCEAAFVKAQAARAAFDAVDAEVAKADAVAEVVK